MIYPWPIERKAPDIRRVCAVYRAVEGELQGPRGFLTILHEALAHDASLTEQAVHIILDAMSAAQYVQRLGDTWTITDKPFPGMYQ